MADEHGVAQTLSLVEHAYKRARKVMGQRFVYRTSSEILTQIHSTGFVFVLQKLKGFQDYIIRSTTSSTVAFFNASPGFSTKTVSFDQTKDTTPFLVKPPSSYGAQAKDYYYCPQTIPLGGSPQQSHSHTILHRPQSTPHHRNPPSTNTFKPPLLLPPTQPHPHSFPRHPLISPPQQNTTQPPLTK